jgi:hypothetical protein
MTVIDNHNSKDIMTCIICGDELESLDREIETHCDFCGKLAKANTGCKSSHIICEDCLNMPVNSYIKKLCLNYNDNDPIALAVEIMNSPLVKMHGSEHHFIVPAVMLTCTYKFMKSANDLSILLDNAEDLAMHTISIDCQYDCKYCGAANGSAIFLNLFMDSDSSDDQILSLDKSLVSRCLNRISQYDLPRCCKRDTYFSIDETIVFLKEKFEIELPKSEAKCIFSLRNKSCGREICMFYNIANSLV